MTNHASGSSLLQARKSHLHRHSHNNNIHHKHHPDDDTAQHTRSHEEEELELRRRQNSPSAADLESVVTEVVQTVSVVQVIDGDGNTVALQTLFTRPPVTPSADQQPTALASGGSQPSPDDAVPTPSPPKSSGGQPSLTAADSSPAVTPSQEPTPLTSAPLSGLFNSTLPGSFNSSSSSVTPLFNNSTHIHSLFANTTRTSSSSSSSSSFATSSFTLSSFSSFITSTESPSSTEVAVATTFVGNGGADSPAGAVGTVPASTSTPTPTPAATTGPTTSTLVGSVVGGVAGLAVLLFVALFLLRWKRRQQNGLRLLGEGDLSSRSRGLPGPGGDSAATATGGGSGGGGGGGGGSGSGSPTGARPSTSRAMSERGLPFAIPQTLAALSGQKYLSAPTPPPPSTADTDTSTSERGFYRVAGRKLPSVLQHGGDGYEDPRASAVSGTTSYRGSDGWWDTGERRRFALGSPMRPESGVMIVQPGPGRTPVRTPVTEQGPIFEHPDEQQHQDQLAPPPLPVLDPIGRTHASQDGSRTSGSRFSEHI